LSAAEKTIVNDFPEKAEVEYKRGLTWRVALACIYAIVVFMPANLFMMLLTNTGVGIGYSVLLFFTGLAAIYGMRLTTQEVWLMLAMSGAVGNTMALGLLQSWYSTRLSLDVWRFRTPDTGLPFSLPCLK